MMKIINDHGLEISENEFKEKLDAIEKTLKFYDEKKHYHWEGCHCHGSYVIDDTGEEANTGLRALNNIRYMIEDQLD